MIERDSPTWRHVDRACVEEIERHRDLLEKAARDALTTEFDRGFVAALRFVLALGAAPKLPAKPAEPYQGY